MKKKRISPTSRIQSRPSLLKAPFHHRKLGPRLRAPVGTRIGRTELMAIQALDLIKCEVGAGNIHITTGFIGVPPASYPIDTICLWTSGPHEAVLPVALKPQARRVV